MASDKTSLHRAHDVGQSIWYDSMRRGLLRSGALAQLIARGVRGMTSNPTIFEKAIVSSGDYEDALRKLDADGRGTIEIYEQLAASELRPDDALTTSTIIGRSSPWCRPNAIASEVAASAVADRKLFSSFMAWPWPGCEPTWKMLPAMASM